MQWAVRYWWSASLPSTATAVKDAVPALQMLPDPSWAMLCVSGLACCVVGGAFGYLIILDGDSRKETRKIASKLIAKITHRN